MKIARTGTGAPPGPESLNVTGFQAETEKAPGMGIAIRVLKYRFKGTTYSPGRHEQDHRYI